MGTKWVSGGLGEGLHFLYFRSKHVSQHLAGYRRPKLKIV